MFAVIINRTSGGGKNSQLPKQIAALLEEIGEVCRIYESKENGGTTKSIRQALGEGCTQVVCVGGDGTLREAVGELAGKPVVLYIVPGGTGNDFARAFGLPKDPIEAFKQQLEGKPVAIDCGKVNDLYFLNISGSGFDVEVLRRTEELKAIYPGEKAYYKAVISVIGKYRAFEADLTLDDGQTEHIKSTIVEVSNGQCIGGGMRVAPDAQLNDGLFDVVVVRTIPHLAIPLLLPIFKLGLHTKLPFARVRRAKKVVLRAKGMIVNLDGELIAMDEAHFEILPGALTMRLPERPGPGLRTFLN